MKVEYDKPIEVSKDKYELLIRVFTGVVAGQIKDGKYYIKVWLMKYAKDVEDELNFNGVLVF